MTIFYFASRVRERKNLSCWMKYCCHGSIHQTPLSFSIDLQGLEWMCVASRSPVFCPDSRAVVFLLHSLLSHSTQAVRKHNMHHAPAAMSGALNDKVLWLGKNAFTRRSLIKITHKYFLILSAIETQESYWVFSCPNELSYTFYNWKKHNVLIFGFGTRTVLSTLLGAE